MHTYFVYTNCIFSDCSNRMVAPGALRGDPLAASAGAFAGALAMLVPSWALAV